MPTYRRTLHVELYGDTKDGIARESSIAWDGIFSALAELAVEFELDAGDLEVDADDSGVFEPVEDGVEDDNQPG